MLSYQVHVVPTSENWIGSPFDNDTLTDLIPDWIAENLQGGWNWDYSWVVEKRSWLLTFRFEDQNDATAFKLRWA
ncbi:MAG: hypothetical protein EOP83_24180 [Verrucomicrobiaceae bacterium]|nr:MAG: hypothetical protein EOP83_24180 [Verrucomicrobiaceae bacterium]